MKILVDHIQDTKPFKLHIEEPVASFPMLSIMQSEGDCTFNGPILGDVTVEREFDHLRLAGRLSATLSLTCSRCLASYEAAVDATFKIYYRKGTPQEIVEEEEVELSEQDLISVTYSGNEIDLSHEIEEQVAMEIPLKPLCSESCKGLCPVCGIDLNRSSCTCQRSQGSLKFSALKDFKVSG